MGYLLTSFVENGRLLSDVFKEEATTELRANLYMDMARIIIRLADVQSPTIGSLTLKEDGQVEVANRPLFLRLPWLEHEGIETDIPRSRTYNSSLSYWKALIRCHDNRLIMQPNSILDEEDGRKQMAALQILKENMEKAILEAKEDQSFHLTLTDLTPTNIFVDTEWRITSIVDLEWACFWPVEMMHPSMWLTGVDVSRLIQAQEAFEAERSIFMAHLAHIEQALKGHATLSQKMERCWMHGSCWAGMILGNTTSAYDLICDHFLPRFYHEGCFEETYKEESKKWTFKSAEFTSMKLDHLAEYQEQIRDLASEE
jgi:hypothetical protein